MNRNRRYTPVAPGAMTPAQLTRQALTQLYAVAMAATATAIFTAIFVMFS